MHEHFLHQVFLKIRIGSQFPCDFLQLFHDYVFSHFDDTMPLLALLIGPNNRPDPACVGPFVLTSCFSS